LASQTEGMVADDETAVLYIGEEKKGIWRFSAEPDNNSEGILIHESSEKNQNIRFDIEGLALYQSGEGKGFLVASSQGNYSYAVFERHGENKYIGSFRIGDGITDGVQETDGIEITNSTLGKLFPEGLLIVQDGYNKDGKKQLPQNFKLVSWKSVSALFQ